MKRMNKVASVYLLLACVNLAVAASNMPSAASAKSAELTKQTPSKQSVPAAAAQLAATCASPFVKGTTDRGSEYCFAAKAGCPEGYLMTSTSGPGTEVCFKGMTPDKCSSFPNCYDRKTQGSGVCECILKTGTTACPTDYKIDNTKTTCMMEKKCDSPSRKVVVAGVMYCGVDPCKHMGHDAGYASVNGMHGCIYYLKK